METVYVRLESRRARMRVDSILNRKTPWVCDLGGRKGARAACTTVSTEEWVRLQECIDLSGWAGITLCTTCAMRQPQQQRLL